MILLDANILLYAYDTASPYYEQASGWIERLFSSDETIAIPWATIWAFLRVRTNVRLVKQPEPLAQTFSIVHEWLALPRFALLEPGPRHAEILEFLATDSKLLGPRLSDAVLAALAVEYGAMLASTDRDFARFDGLRWVDPLAAGGKR